MLYCFSTETSKSWKLTLTHNTYISVHLCVSTHRYTCIHTRSSIQFSHLVVPTLYDPMDYSMPGLPAHRQLPEFTQTHVHWIGNVIQPSLSVIPFFSCLQSFPASGSFQMSQLFTSGQSIGASASASVLPMNTQGWFPLGWTGFDLLAVQGTLQTLLQHHSSKASILWWSAFFMVQVSHPYMTIGKTIALTIFYSVQSLHCVRLFATPWTAAHPGLPVHHQLLELAQTHVHQVSDATQPSHPLLSPSPPAFNVSQHQAFFQWGNSSH